MAHKYREDKDLEFLAYADNAMLDILVTYLTKDENGKVRTTESLLNDKEFIAAKGNYQSVWKLIAAELQHFGGDTVINTLRGTGILYREILTDVASKFSIQYQANDNIEKIEDALIQKVFEKSWESLNSEQRNQFLHDKGIQISAANASISGVIASFTTYQLSAIVADMIAVQFGRKLLTTTVGRLLATSYAVPIGILLTIPMITGAAYRVTFPSVLQIALMRKQMLNKDMF